MTVVDTNNLETPPEILVSFDPGKTTGVAVFVDGAVTEFFDVKIEDMPFWFRQLEVDYKDKPVTIVYENFKLFKWKSQQQSGSTMEASQVIGQIKAAAAFNKWDIYDQSPQIKPIAQKWSKAVPPSNHKLSHSIDAYNHGYYWLVSKGMKKIGS